MSVNAVPVTASAPIDEAFAREHERTYGHRAGADEPVEIVSLRVVGQGLSDRPRVPERVQIGRGAGTIGGSRRVYFGPREGWIVAQVLARSDLATPREGPAIVGGHLALIRAGESSARILATAAAGDDREAFQRWLLAISA